MFWYLCITTLTAMASLPLYRILAPAIKSRSLVMFGKHICPFKIWLAITTTTNVTGRDFSSSGTKEPRQSYRLYTRTGDNGTSGLFNGERRPKDDVVFEALGSTDELTSFIGLAREYIQDETVNAELEQIQCILQDLQATIATPKSSSNESQLLKTKWNAGHIVDLEAWIDAHTETLPPLTNFILPSGGKASATLHVARAICRRAERRLVPLLDEGLELPVIQYLNRLSSYLFTVARVCSRLEGRPETIYK